MTLDQLLNFSGTSLIDANFFKKSDINLLEKTYPLCDPRDIDPAMIAVCSKEIFDLMPYIKFKNVFTISEVAKELEVGLKILNERSSFYTDVLYGKIDFKILMNVIYKQLNKELLE